ncbi:hypothetical protein GCM10009674_24910 [Nesterenkonia xinjiangensis]
MEFREVVLGGTCQEQAWGEGLCGGHRPGFRAHGRTLRRGSDEQRRAGPVPDSRLRNTQAAGTPPWGILPPERMVRDTLLILTQDSA